MRLTREDLYLLIWAMPATKLGQKLDVSGNAVLKACKKWGIPVPGRGYWSRRQVGQLLEVPALRLGASPGEPPSVLPEHAAEITELLMRLLTSHQQGAVAFNRVVEEPEPSASVETTENRSPSGLTGPSTSAPTDSVALRTDDAMPFAAMLSGLAVQFEEGLRIDRLLEALEVERLECDPATAAVVILWLQSARRARCELDPVEDVLASCRRIANGRASPPWWQEAQLAKSR